MLWKTLTTFKQAQTHCMAHTQHHLGLLAPKNHRISKYAAMLDAVGAERAGVGE